MNNTKIKPGAYRSLIFGAEEQIAVIDDETVAYRLVTTLSPETPWVFRKVYSRKDGSLYFIVNKRRNNVSDFLRCDYAPKV